MQSMGRREDLPGRLAAKKRNLATSFIEDDHGVWFFILRYTHSDIVWKSTDRICELTSAVMRPFPGAKRPPFNARPR